MDDSIAQARPRLAALELGGWKTIVGLICALILAAVFIASGAPKIVMPFQAAAKMMQAKIPASLSMLAALGFGVAEVFAAVLILVPRFRRWGALLIGAMLIAFMIYVGANYNQLRGEDCSCFPWLKEEVSPWFFVRDGSWLLLAVIAGWWAERSSGIRAAIVILGAITVFAAVSYGVNQARQTGTPAPAAILVDGREQSIQFGKVALFFFDPECLHCFFSAKQVAPYKWRPDVRVISVPRVQPQFAAGFLKDTGLKAAISGSFQSLDAAFHVQKEGASMVLLENGRAVAPEVINFEKDEPATTLRKLKFIE